MTPLQRHGSLRPPRKMVAHDLGTAPIKAPLLDYLEVKFGAICGSERIRALAEGGAVQLLIAGAPLEG
ncbi:hypothetical protein GCM10011324_04480 [Allosediminivita pacifica]|uniref:Uncharacterized protein n=1 Tax=Allosediminivita pacifica TaxID=1267769 RepID=A0A2T6B7L8_9RHOB|nr:hypothetical protein C8N44_102125 [Allosediminivita pacifica]GGA97315.1 hypothetical protein GCM10011324_04480 [Allosediminivita pacifica]